MDTLAQRLKTARQERGISQAEAARRVGIKQPTLSSLESGESKTTVHIAKFAAVYGVSALWLGEGRGPKVTAQSEIDASIQAMSGQSADLPSLATVAKAIEGVIAVAKAPLEACSAKDLEQIEQRIIKSLRAAAGPKKGAASEDWEMPEWMRGPVPPSEGYQEAVLIEDDGKPLIRNMDDAEAASERERKARGGTKKRA